METKILEKAKKIIDNRQYDAITKAQNNKIKALANEEFKSIYNRYFDSMMDDARNGKDSSEKTLSLEKEYKNWLKNNNFDSISPKYYCPKCNDSGYLEGKYCDCLIEEINNLLKLESGFLNLEDFDKADFEIFENKQYMKTLYEKMQKWCYGDFAKNLIYLSGQTGVGKTHLMKCMANELIKRHKLVRLTTSFAMHQDFVKSYATKDLFEKQALLDKYLTAEVLFIDDLGTELRQRDITVNYLYQIINERKMQKRPTIITSNLTLEDVMEYYDERIVSRIADKSSSICIYIEGNDLRLK